MKSSCIPHGLALAAALALSPSGAFAALGALHSLSDAEMSSVYGRGLSDPTLSAMGALTPQQQSGSAVSAADALAAFGAIDSDSAQTIDRQLSQQRLQTAANGVQTTVRLAQNLTALTTAFAPFTNVVSLPMLSLPLFGLPSLASLAALDKKH